MIDDLHVGGCLCGTIRYRAEGVPKWIAYCHCQSCRRATGAPVTAYAGFLRPQVSFVAGEPDQVQLIGGRRPHLLRAMRHAADLRGRSLAR